MLREDLERMANQIASFWEAYPDAEAVEGVRDHLAKFWDPAMRKELWILAASTSHSLHPLVLRAVAQLRASAPE